MYMTSPYPNSYITYVTQSGGYTLVPHPRRHGWSYHRRIRRDSYPRHTSQGRCSRKRSSGQHSLKTVIWPVVRRRRIYSDQL